MVVNDLVLAKQFVLGKTRCTEDLSEDMNTGHFVVGLILNLGNAEFWVSEVQFKRQQGRWKKLGFGFSFLDCLSLEQHRGLILGFGLVVCYESRTL